MSPSPFGDPTEAGSPSQQRLRDRAWTCALLAGALAVLLVAVGLGRARPTMNQPTWRWFQ
ncbi:MAG: hypothetical protein U9R47_06145 [Actinomycetota bacterium]|nr:hypothetical protein [Actinomycetota bacterium]